MSKQTYVIHPIPLFNCEMPTARMVSHTSYGQVLPMTIYIWYLEGTKQNVIVDAGYKPETNRAYGYKTDTIQTLAEGLKTVGLSVNDVDVILATHLHIDHMELAHEFPKARIVVQRRELDFALNPHPLFATAFPPVIVKGLDFEIVDGDTRFEDGINLIFTPGHSPGGQSVAVRTAKGLTIITGFCCIQANFQPLPPDIHQWGPPDAKKRTFTIPGMHVNPLEAYDSMLKVMKLADVVIPVHEQNIKAI